MGPVPASAVTLDPRSGELRFVADANGQSVVFTGKILGNNLRGKVRWKSSPTETWRIEPIYLREVEHLDLLNACP